MKIFLKGKRKERVKGNLIRCREKFSHSVKIKQKGMTCEHDLCYS